MQVDTAGKFTQIVMSTVEQQQAVAVTPYFMAYLQNKIAAYAGALVDSKLPYDPDPSKQVTAILEHERLRNFVAAYEELFAELAHSQPEDKSSQHPE